VFSIFAEGLIPSAIYYVALLLIVAGIVLYEAGPSPLGHATPSDIKITMQLESDTAEHAANLTKGGMTAGYVEMT